MLDDEVFEYVNVLPREERASEIRRLCAEDPEQAERLLRWLDESSRRVKPAMGPVLEPGEAFGRFEIVDKLGMGAMGIVYSAHDPKLGRRVALKLLLEAAPAADPSRLLREARAAAQVEHPNVISIYEVGEHDGHVYIVMELVDGITLQDWLGREAPCAWRHVLDVMIPSGRALHAAHEAGLVHRDFKPANVLLGPGGRVVVTDFGLAKPSVWAKGDSMSPSLERSDGSVDRTLTAKGTLLGTPRYMAHEQWIHAGLDGRTDQFAFCVVMFEALFGAHPFLHAETNLYELEERVTREHVRPIPWRKRARVPGWLRKIVRRGLSAAPEQRFRDMRELLEAIERGRRVQRIVYIAPFSVLAAGVAAAGVVSLTREPLCRQPGLAASPVIAISAALGKTPSEAEQVRLKSLQARLDHYSTRWKASWTEACQAHADGKLDRTAYQARLECLKERRHDFIALTSALAKAAIPPEGVEFRLDPGDCVLSHAPAGHEASTQLGELLRSAWLTYKAGDASKSRALAEQVLTRTGGPGTESERAQALLWRAYASWYALDLELVLADFMAAAALAEVIGADALFVEASIGMLQLPDLRSPDLAGRKLLLELSLAKLARRGGLGTALEGELHAAASSLFLAYRDDVRAKEHAMAAIRLLGEAYGANDPQVITKSIDLANVHSRRGEHAQAIELAQDALLRMERIHPGDHPLIMRTMLESASIHGRAGALDAAAPLYERVAAWRPAHGGHSQIVLDASVELAWLRFERGDLGGALEIVDRFIASLDRDSREGIFLAERPYHVARGVYEAAERFESALAALRTELRLAETSPAVDSEDLAEMKLREIEYLIRLELNDAATHMLRSYESWLLAHGQQSFVDAYWKFLNSSNTE